MNKKILGLIATSMITVVAVFNVNVNFNEGLLSDVSLANIEALADAEIIVEELCLMGPNDFCEYPPFPGYPYWDIIENGTVRF